MHTRCGMRSSGMLFDGSFCATRCHCRSSLCPVGGVTRFQLDTNSQERDEQI
jgi:hypothetical protein